MKKTFILSLVIVMLAHNLCATESKVVHVTCINNQTVFTVSLDSQLVNAGNSVVLKKRPIIIPFITATRKYRSQMVAGVYYVPENAIALKIGNLCWRLWRDERGIIYVLEKSLDYDAHNSSYTTPTTLVKDALLGKLLRLEITDQFNFSLK
ncbi:MAG: hypothetical protein WC707_05105 [Candidatus Babeliaceae bacterium]